MKKYEWRRDPRTGDCYYEDRSDKFGGIGYVQRASKESGGGWLAVCLEPAGSDVTTTLAAGKRFVEKQVASGKRRGKRGKKC